MSEVSDAVVALLDCMDRCGSVAVQSIGLLSPGTGGVGDGAVSDAAGVMIALESLRRLSESRLEAVCADEAVAYEAVRGYLRGLDSCVGGEVVSASMALFTLGCRNGLAVCGAVDVLEQTGGMLIKWHEAASGGGVAAVDCAAGAALSCAYTVTSFSSVQIPSESRGPMEKAFRVWTKARLGTVGKAFTEQRVCEIFTGSMRAGILSQEDTSLACGWCSVGFDLGYMFTGALPTADDAGVFSAGLALYRRVEPLPLGVDWWSSTYDVVDVTSTRLTLLWHLLTVARRVPSAAQSSWWSELLDRAIGVSKMNASAGLSGRDTMNMFAVMYALGIVEVAAQDESQHEMLIGSGVMDALEYAILHDFEFMELSVAQYASGAAVALVGRNEGGKVLRLEAVHAVLDRLQGCFNPESPQCTLPAKTMMPHVTRISIMVISDANKKHMLQYEPLIDMLLQCLIIDDDNHRKGQDGADALQEASAGVLHELSLYRPGAAALRSHGSAVSTLHKLCDVGTKVSRERGAAALFELEEDKRPQAHEKTVAGDDDGTGTGLSSSMSGSKMPPPHVMASYNWDHQDVILRVVGSLQSRGYLVWVDTEQMKGATVDTMALAVEGSAVVLVGVSRAYKESSNCRMEAQYALQKKKPLVPLMLVEGYEADGWLGLLLGTSMWYALYGATLSSESAFEDRMDALCREIGSRGRADAEIISVSSVAMSGSEVAAEERGSSEAEAMLNAELQSLRVKELRQRASMEGVDDDVVGDALAADNPKAALIGLLVDHIASRGPTEEVLSILAGGGAASAEMLSGVLDHAMDVLDQVSMSSPRKGRRALRDVSDRVEAVMDLIDGEWCDGVSRCGQDELDRLIGLVVSVRDLSASSSMSEVSDAVSDAIDCLDRCGSVAVQSIGLLSPGTGGVGDGAVSDAAGVMIALESLRGLSESRLEAVCADEAVAYEAVRGYLRGLDSCVGGEVVSASMALFTLGCRNGLAVCGTVDVLEQTGGMFIKWYEAASCGGVAAVDYAAGAALSCAYSVTSFSSVQIPSESRGPMEKAFRIWTKARLGTVGKAFTEQRVCEIFTGSMRAGILSQEDLS
eukprot:COSAG06_NODE_5830_length_3253_cov_113.318643_1_plen_1084_part_11